MIRKVFCLFFMYLFSLSSFAQGEELVLMKGDCMQSFVGEAPSLQGTRRAALNPMTNWDANKIYKQMVVLFSFSDVDFLETHSKEYYQQVFNEEGYIEREGKGCVADYFREQSGGLVNFEFDIYGPVQVSTKAQPYDAPNANTRNYGKEPMMEALQRVLDENPTVDFSQYDWNGDSIVEQVIFVYAGLPGNVSASSYGHIWPNTGTFSTITTPDGFAIFNYTASGERYPTSPEVSCGIGTICHEFCHSLGLPDIYPTGSSAIYSAVDEWDLMDGGNFTNLGWCPPNFSAMEKMLLGWLTPVELTEPTTITDMESVSNGGAVYQIKHTDTEYLLLENRQQDGWDKGNPGKGLLIYHVNYNPSSWNNNRVNAFAEEKDFLYQLVHADNMSYNDWDNYLKTAGFSSAYAKSGRMNKLHLSTSPYPCDTNNEFTDTSVPSAEMQTKNADDLTLLSKAITNIQVSDDGLVSFDFMGGTTGINNLRVLDEDGVSCLYDLSGQRVYIPLPGRMYIAKRKDGTTYKYIHSYEQ